ncbi:MAG: tetratricopeptide repeat protein [Victivallales bacterium]|nr:tetratricopeptide repeat protein [Victivallales bacterium]
MDDAYDISGQLLKNYKDFGFSDTPAEPDKQYILGCCRELCLDYTGAENHFMKARQLQPDNFNVLYKLGSISLIGHKPDDAEEYFRKCLKLKGDSTRVLFHLGSIAFEKKRWNQAITFFTRLLKIDNDLSDAWYMLGMSYRAQSKLLKAIEAFNEAAERSEHEIDIHFALADVYQQLFRFNEAIIEYQHVLEQVPDSPRIMLGMARLYFMTGDRKAAEVVIRKVINKSMAPYNQCAQKLYDAWRGIPQTTTPGAILAELFAPWPEQFDRSVMEKLKYCIPPHLESILLAASGKDAFVSALEIGCGNGSAGKIYAEFTGSLSGIDTSGDSTGLLPQGIYSEIKIGNAVAVMSGTHRKYDLLLATDLFLYCGELHKLFAQASRVSSHNAYFVFTTEHTDVADFVLSRTGLFAHSLEYIDKLAHKYNFEIICCQESGCHHFNNFIIYVLQKK